MEAAPITPNDPPPSWPEKGAISFSHVKLAYRPGLPLVLKDVSFEIKAGEKVTASLHIQLLLTFLNQIGICGRTGAGKSSMLQALFRIVEIEEGGRIEIDGVNTREIGLDALRQRLAVIPQDALLFKGTVRENMCVFNFLDIT